MKKFSYLFGLCAYVVGAIGGMGYALYNKAYFIATCVAVLVWMGFPIAKKWLCCLLDKEN